MKRLMIGGLAALTIGLGIAPVALANPDDVTCRTDPGSGYSYTYCHWVDANGINHGTVTTCYGGGSCTTREER